MHYIILLGRWQKNAYLLQICHQRQWQTKEMSPPRSNAHDHVSSYFKRKYESLFWAKYEWLWPWNHRFWLPQIICSMWMLSRELLWFQNKRKSQIKAFTVDRQTVLLQFLFYFSFKLSKIRYIKGKGGKLPWVGGILEEEHLLLEILDLSGDDLNFGVGRNLWSIKSFQCL